MQIGNIIIDGTTGSISFTGDPGIVKVQYSLSKNGPWQYEWNGSWVDVSVWARYSYDSGATWGSPVLIQGKNGEDGADGSDANIPEYIRSTYIDFTRVESPTIMGNEIQTLGSFQVGIGSRTNFTPTGFLGRAQGLDAFGNETWGVALGTKYSNETNLGDIYLIVTDKGVRMTAGSHSLTVTGNGAFYDDLELGTAGSQAIAVFG